MHYLGSIVFVAILCLCWGLTLFALPGNWLIVLSSGLFAYFFPTAVPGLTATVVAILAALALFGELVELGAGAAGIKRGGSKRGAVLAIVGSFAGGIVGAGVGLPVPVVGSIVGVVIFAAAGGMIGAMLGEIWKGKQTSEALQIGKAAFWARLIGSAMKLAIGAIMAVVAAAVIVMH